MQRPDFLSSVRAAEVRRHGRCFCALVAPQRDGSMFVGTYTHPAAGFRRWRILCRRPASGPCIIPTAVLYYAHSMAQRSTGSGEPRCSVLRLKSRSWLRAISFHVAVAPSGSAARRRLVSLTTRPHGVLARDCGFLPRPRPGAAARDDFDMGTCHWAAMSAACARPGPQGLCALQGRAAAATARVAVPLVLPPHPGWRAERLAADVPWA